VSDVTACIVCGGARVAPFLRIENAPVSCNHLCSTRLAALNEPTAEISLGFCPDCGHVFNLAYDPARLSYRPGYESSLRGSERFRQYDDALADALLDRYQLRGLLIVEIGCGRGEFLRTLCERGGNSGIGFDPSYRSEDGEENITPGVVIRPEVYNGDKEHLNADFICSRHTLEHVGDPRGFLSNVRKATAQLGIPVFFEVPNGLFTIRDGGIWDIIYEHCSYFTPSSLARVFHETGYYTVEVAETFGTQFLTIHARTGAPRQEVAPVASADLQSLVKSFAKSYRSRLKDWTRRLQELEREGRKVVLWGAGAKAATFLNLLRPRGIDYVVDVNPRKHGNYVIGTGQGIVAPEFLREYVADDIICMNPNYLAEIACRARELGLEANIICA
jgi:SAM-dependent methyltransferase